jgi:REP element-mobilizing transposase RayT
MKTQNTLFEYFETPELKARYSRTAHGGASLKGRRKLERPLSAKKWIHLTMKSDKAKGQYSFLSAKNQILVEQILKAKAKKFGVKIADFANVGNHLHLKIKIQNRHTFQQFLKSVTTLIARKITNARRGHKFGRFWQGLAYTRILKSSLEELNLKGYFQANRVEAQKGQQKREEFLKQFNTWVYRSQEQEYLQRLRNKALATVGNRGIV